MQYDLGKHNFMQITRFKLLAKRSWAKEAHTGTRQYRAASLCMHALDVFITYHLHCMTYSCHAMPSGELRLDRWHAICWDSLCFTSLL
jgi:hypothetical protein